MALEQHWQHLEDQKSAGCKCRAEVQRCNSKSALVSWVHSKPCQSTAPLQPCPAWTPSLRSCHRHLLRWGLDSPLTLTPHQFLMILAVQPQSELVSQPEEWRLFWRWCSSLSGCPQGWWTVRSQWIGWCICCVCLLGWGTWCPTESVSSTAPGSKNFLPRMKNANGLVVGGSGNWLKQSSINLCSAVPDSLLKSLVCLFISLWIFWIVSRCSLNIFLICDCENQGSFLFHCFVCPLVGAITKSKGRLNHIDNICDYPQQKRFVTPFKHIAFWSLICHVLATFTCTVKIHTMHYECKSVDVAGWTNNVNRRPIFFCLWR